MQRQYSRAAGPSVTSILWPHCPNCDERMRPGSIAPGASAFDIRTFECAGCHPIRTAMAEIDPMKSHAILWLASHDLRSPS
jgi:hypothetical protein